MRVTRLIMLASLVAAANACGAAPGAAGSAGAGAGPAAAWPAEATPEAIAEGKMLFHTGSCVRCHANNGDGSTSGPALSDRQWVHSTGSFASIVSIIREGVPQSELSPGYGRPMPPRGAVNMNTPPLTDAQVTSIAAYVYSISHTPPGGTSKQP
ncbi:MAG TPA: c-type cytochrome [Gemmatimonadaceae bacterium]|nr:c-type cytochrome [Gemmatimonadaceae bacterium]